MVEKFGSSLVMVKLVCFMAIFFLENHHLWNPLNLYSEYALECNKKWVVIDQSGELYNNPVTKNIFKKCCYNSYPTSSDSSNPVERAHQTISQGVKALLIGAGLEVKFGLYSFVHILCICNALPGQGQDESPLFLQKIKRTFKICRFLDVKFGYDQLY